MSTHKVENKFLEIVKEKERKVFLARPTYYHVRHFNEINTPQGIKVRVVDFGKSSMRDIGPIFPPLSLIASSTATNALTKVRDLQLQLDDIADELESSIEYTKKNTPDDDLPATYSADVTSNVEEPLRSTIRLIPFDGESDFVLTGSVLREFVLPFIEALFALQAIQDEISGLPPNLFPRVHMIEQNSPIQINLDVGNVIDSVDKVITPSRRKHQKIMDAAEIAEQEAQIQLLTAQIIQRKAQAESQNAEREQKLAEAKKLRAEAEALFVSAEKTRAEAQQIKIKTALDVIEWMNPNLSDEDRVAYATRILQATNIISESPFILAPVKKSSASNDENP